MQTIRRSSFFIVTFTIFAVLISATSTAYAQTRQGADPNATLIDIDFPGGTLESYVQTILKKADANILLPNEAKIIELPPVRLLKADVSSAIKLLEALPVDQRFARLKVGMQRADRPDALNIYTIRTLKQSGSGVQHAMNSVVVSVADLLDFGVSEADMLTSIETSLALFENDAPQAKVRFHKETGLIIARGTVEQTNMIREVAHQVRESVLSRKDVAEYRQAQTRLEQTQNILNNFKSQYSDQTAEVENLKKQIRNLDMTTVDLQQQVQLRDLTISRLEAEIAMLRSQIEKSGG